MVTKYFYKISCTPNFSTNYFCNSSNVFMGELLI